MKRLWAFFSSTYLTIVLAALVCIDAAWGSVLCVRYPQYFRAVDSKILFPWLLADGAQEPGLTLWIYLLVVLVALFTVNTVVCTADKLYSIVKNKRPIQSFFPHIVHIGFLIALLGHLAGSTYGFRSYGNILFMDEPAPVPHTPGLVMRLDAFEQKAGPTGELESMKTTVTLLKENTVVKTGDIEINGPLIYRGVAFYHLDHGTTPSGLVLDVDGELSRAGLDRPFTAAGKSFSLGTVYPDFALDSAGEPYTRSYNYTNPHIEVISGDGQRAYLDLKRPGSAVTLAGSVVRLENYIISEYVVLSVNKDPGIWLIIAGSSILVLGMLALLFFRGERSELVRQAR